MTNVLDLHETIEAYGKDLKEVLLPALRQKFGGIRMIVI